MIQCLKESIDELCKADDVSLAAQRADTSYVRGLHLKFPAQSPAKNNCQWAGLVL